MFGRYNRSSFEMQQFRLMVVSFFKKTCVMKIMEICSFIFSRLLGRRILHRGALVTLFCKRFGKHVS